MILILSFLTFLTWTGPAFSYQEVNASCREQVVLASHASALAMIKKAEQVLHRPADTQLLAQGLTKYFKLDPALTSNRNQIQQVFAAVERVAARAGETSYVCHNKVRGFWCYGSQDAVVPPPKKSVHLCPSFFRELSHKEQDLTILHEWFHRWGGNEIDYVPEVYCHQLLDLSSDKLIQQADQYMLFIYYLFSEGREINCGQRLR